MTTLDWIVIGVYFMGIVAFALAQARRQTTLRDYYLAGRRVTWWHSGLSTMATQLGAISFVSAPAFVALKDDGGLKWLCYELGVPFGILFVVVLIIPRLHRGSYISIYEYLEDRFDRGTRTLVSLLFQLGRGLATAVSVLAGGLIISTATPLSTNGAILLIGAVTILYDVLGGMRVVVVSDVFQMLIIVAGVALCGGTALSIVGWSEAWGAMSPERLQVLDFSRWGLSSGGEYAFWPMTIGGIFLYASYYGCDQSQVQREMSVGSLRDVRRSLLLNAFGRFPVVLMYCVMGVLVGAVFTSPEHLATVASRLGTDASSLGATLGADPDRMVPMFILALLPAGLVGFVFVAILSALMSSLDSAINSLSAVTMRDFYQPYIKRHASTRHYLVVSKVLTLSWGGFCILAAMGFASAAEATRQTTIVLINAVGSLLYGPILAAFFAGMTTRFLSAFEVNAGVVVGILANVFLWRWSDVSWLWWNVSGFAVTLGVAFAVHGLFVITGRRPASVPAPGGRKTPTGLVTASVSVFLYFLLITAVAYGVQQMG